MSWLKSWVTSKISNTGNTNNDNSTKKNRASDKKKGIKEINQPIHIRKTEVKLETWNFLSKEPSCSVSLDQVTIQLAEQNTGKPGDEQKGKLNNLICLIIRLVEEKKTSSSELTSKIDLSSTIAQTVKYFEKNVQEILSSNKDGNISEALIQFFSVSTSISFGTEAFRFVELFLESNINIFAKHGSFCGCILEIMNIFCKNYNENTEDKSSIQHRTALLVQSMCCYPILVQAFISTNSLYLNFVNICQKFSDVEIIENESFSSEVSIDDDISEEENNNLDTPENIREFKDCTLREDAFQIVDILTAHYLQDKNTLDHLSECGVLLKIINEVTNMCNVLKVEIILKICEIILEILRNSSKKSELLLNDFSNGNGYDFLLQLLIFLESKAGFYWTNMLDICRSFTYVGNVHLTPYAAIEVEEMNSSKTLKKSDSPKKNRKNVNELTDSQDENRGKKIKNTLAFQVLQNYFVKSESETKRLKILDTILGIYADDQKNFLILQPLHTVAYFIEHWDLLSSKLREAILDKVLVFVATVVDVVPFQELSGLGCLLMDNATPTTLVLIKQLVVKLVDFDSKYRNILRSAGLFDVFIQLLQKSYKEYFGQTSEDKLNSLLSESGTNSISKIQILVRTMECLALLLEKNEENANIFREWGGVDTILGLVKNTQTRSSALTVIECLSSANPNQDYISGLVKVLQSLPGRNYSTKNHILLSIRNIFKTSSQSNSKLQVSFQEIGGFLCILSILAEMENCFSAESDLNSPKPKQQFLLLEQLIRTTTAAIMNNDHNRVSLNDQIGFQTFGLCVKSTGILLTKWASYPLLWLIDMATETEDSYTSKYNNFKINAANSVLNCSIAHHPSYLKGDLKSDNTLSQSFIKFSFPESDESDSNSEDSESNESTNPNPNIENGEIISLVINLLVELSAQQKILVINRLNILASDSASNKYILSQHGIIAKIFDTFPELLCGILIPDESDYSETIAFKRSLLQLIENIAYFNISVKEYFQLFYLVRIGSQFSNSNGPPVELLETLLYMVKFGRTPPFIQFDMSKNRFSFASIPSMGERHWPPPGTGYSVSFWIYIDLFDGDQIDLLSFLSTDKKISTTFLIDESGILNLKISHHGSTVYPRFPSFLFEEKRWYHLVVVHARNKLKFKSSTVELFINGVSKGTDKAPYSTPSSCSLNIQIGSSNRLDRSFQKWGLGPFYLMEEALGPSTVNTIYNIGPSYVGNFSANFPQYQTYEIINSSNLSSLHVHGLDSQSTLGTLDLAKNEHLTRLKDSILVNLNARNAQKSEFNKGNDIVLNSSENNILANNYTTVTKNPRGVLTASTPASNSLASSPPLISTLLSNATISKVTASNSAPNLIANVPTMNQFNEALLMGSAKPFYPKTAQQIGRVGGMSASLYLINKSKISEQLSCSIAIMVQLIAHNHKNTAEMEVINGYEIVASLLREKQELLDFECMKILWELVGVSLADPRIGTISNLEACKYFFLDFTVWKNSSLNLQKEVWIQINNLISPSNFQRKFNIDRLRELNIIKNLLLVLRDDHLNEDLISLIIDVIESIFTINIEIEDLNIISNFLICLLNRRLQFMRRPSVKSSTQNFNENSTRNLTSPILSNDLFSSRTKQICDQILSTILNLILKGQHISQFLKVITPTWAVSFIQLNLPNSVLSLVLQISNSLLF